MKLVGMVKDYLGEKITQIDVQEGICQLVDKLLASRGFLLVSSKDQIVGTVTEMDVVRAIYKSKKPSDLKVKDCMTACNLTGHEICVQIGDDRPADEALKIMITSDIKQLLVFDHKTKKIIGVISISKLLQGLKECQLKI